MNLLGIFKNFHLYLLKNKNMYNNRYFHYWNKLKFDYNECLGRIASTKPVKKHMRRMKTLEWRIRINRKEFIVNPLGGGKHTFHLFNRSSMEIKNVGQLRKIIENLPNDFEIEMRVRRKLTDEELKNCRYPYPYDTEYLTLEFDDIGVSNKVLCLGVTSNE